MSSGCLQDASARVTIEIINLALSALSAEERMELSKACATEIASTCGVEESSVVDLQGRSSSVSIGEDGSISAFVLSIGDGPSANELAARLYSSYFRLVLESITMSVGGEVNSAGSSQV